MTQPHRPSLDPASPRPEDLEQFERDGFMVLRGLFSPPEVQELLQAFMRQNEGGPVPGLSDIRSDFRPDDPLSRYPRMIHPYKHPELPVGEISRRSLLDPRLGQVLRHLFGEEPLAAQSMFYFKPPGSRGQSLHQDNFFLRVYPGTCIAAWVALDDADAENGTMIVVPGTHTLEITCPESSADATVFFTSEQVAVPEGAQEVAVNLRAGDVLFFGGSLIHGSYPNSSKDRFRRSFIGHYVPRSSEEVSHYYHPLLSFSREEVEVADAQGGGPCGTAQAMGPH